MYLSLSRYKTATLVRIEPSTSRSVVRRSTTRPSRLPIFDEISVTQRLWRLVCVYTVYRFPKIWTPSSYGLSYLKLGRELQSNLYIWKMCPFTFGRILIILLSFLATAYLFTLLKTNLFQICKFNTNKQVQLDIIHTFWASVYAVQITFLLTDTCINRICICVSIQILKCRWQADVSNAKTRLLMIWYKMPQIIASYFIKTRAANKRSNCIMYNKCTHIYLIHL